MTRRLRPSLRKLEKAERAAQPGPFKSTYEARLAAVHRVEARLSAALDRINVAAQATEFGIGSVAQIGHARRFIEDGRDEPEGWPFRVPTRRADELVVMLAELYHDAYVAELMDREIARRNEVAS